MVKINSLQSFEKGEKNRFETPVTANQVFDKAISVFLILSAKQCSYCLKTTSVRHRFHSENTDSIQFNALHNYRIVCSLANYKRTIFCVWDGRRCGNWKMNSKRKKKRKEKWTKRLRCEILLRKKGEEKSVSNWPKSLAFPNSVHMIIILVLRKCWRLRAVYDR